MNVSPTVTFVVAWFLKGRFTPNTKKTTFFNYLISTQSIHQFARHSQV